MTAPGALVILIAAVGCAGVRIAEASGSYSLLEYNGQPLPVVERSMFRICRGPPGESRTCTTEITPCKRVLSSGMLSLHADRGFSMYWERTNSCTGELLQASRISGRYTRTGKGDLMFRRDGSADPDRVFEGRIVQDRIVVTIGAGSLVFGH